MGTMRDPLGAVLHSTPFRGHSGYRSTPRGSLWQVHLATGLREEAAHQVVGGRDLGGEPKHKRFVWFCKGMAAVYLGVVLKKL